MTSEAELEQMWNKISSIDRNSISDHVTLSAGLDLSNRSYQEALEDISSWCPNVFKNMLIWIANNRVGELYVKEGSTYVHAFYK